LADDFSRDGPAYNRAKRIGRNFEQPVKNQSTFNHLSDFILLLFVLLLFLGFSSPLKHNATINGIATINEKKHLYKGDMYNYARERDFLNCFYTTCKK
jgi:hypothetical protein